MLPKSLSELTVVAIRHSLLGTLDDMEKSYFSEVDAATPIPSDLSGRGFRETDDVCTCKPRCLDSNTRTLIIWTRSKRDGNVITYKPSGKVRTVFLRHEPSVC